MKKTNTISKGIPSAVVAMIYFLVIPLLAVILLEFPLKNFTAGFIIDKDLFFVSVIKGIILPFLFVLSAYLRYRDGKKPELLKGAGLFLASYLAIAVMIEVLNIIFEYHTVRVLSWYYSISLIPVIYVKYEELLKTLATAWETTAEKTSPFTKKYIKPWTDKAAAVMKPAAKIMSTFKIPAGKIKAAAAILLIIAALVVNYLTFFGNYFGVIKVVELSPKGQTEAGSVIKAVFSYEVEPFLANKDNPAVFSIKPGIKGKYIFVDGKTVVFRPSEALTPAVKYSVDVNTKAFISKNKMITGKSTSFYAPGLMVSESNFYMNLNPVSKKLDELTGEIMFNYPVAAAKLKEYISAKKFMAVEKNKGFIEESKAIFSVENTQDRKRFLVKITGLDDSDARNFVDFSIKAGLPGDGFDSPMRKEFKQKIKILRDEKLEALKAMSWHTEGKTSIAIRFNMPVAPQEVKTHIKINRENRNYYYNDEEGDGGGDDGEGDDGQITNFSVSCDHNYAIIDGDFKAGKRYRVSIDYGLMALTGETYRGDDSLYVDLENMPSGVNFAEQGEILTPGGSMTIPVRIVNQSEINVRVYKVERENLKCFLDNRDYAADHAGKLVFEQNKLISGYTLNKEFIEYIKLDNMDRFGGKGVFYIELGNGQRKTVNVTDLGMIVKYTEGRTEVKVLSIKSLDPVAGVAVKIAGRTGTIILQKVSDVDGKATFNMDMPELYKKDPAYILAERAGDFSFMDFNGSSLALNNMNFDTGGEPNGSGGMKAFISTDRGLYRPGDMVMLTGIIRNLDMTVPPHIFARWLVTGPTGETLVDTKKKIEGNGIALLGVKTSSYEKTGQYTANLYVNDNRLSSENFKIEEFIPDKIETIVTAGKKTYKAGEKLEFTIKANQLFGPPASGNKVQAEIRLDAYTYENAKYPDYVFNDQERVFNKSTIELGEDILSQDGEKKYENDIPEDMMPPSMVKAEFFAEVFDDGGRPVSGYNSALVSVYDKYFGIKLPENRRSFKEGEEIPVDLVSLDAQGTTSTSKKVHVSVSRKIWYSIYRFNWWNNDSYESESYMDQVSDVYMDLKDGKGVYKLVPDTGGEYTVRAGYDDAMTSSVSFNVSGQGTESNYNLSKADRAEVITDKPRYNPGETVNAVIKAPFDGTAIVYIEREKVFEEKQVKVKDGTGKVSFTFKAAYFPNVYITAMVIRKPDQKYLSMPFVSSCIKSVQGNLSSRRITAKINTKAEVFSSDGMDVKVQLKNAGPGASVMLTAVDEGILQIIRFLTPDPLESFYGKKALEVYTATMFNMLLSEAKADKQPIGGDYSEPVRKHLNPVAAQIVKAYAKFSGILHPGLTGEVDYHFDTKDFNGKVRIMAMMVDNDKMGSGEEYVQITDPLVVIPHLPRFLAPGDVFQTVAGVYNNTGKKGKFKATLTISGPVKISGSATIEADIGDKREEKIIFNCIAGSEPGKAVFNFAVSGNGSDKQKVMELPVRPAAHNKVTVLKGYLKPGEKISTEVPKDIMRQGRDINLSVSYSRVAEYAGALKYLIHYPYGCIEQTTSSVYPMIFFKGLGLLEGELKDQAGNVDAYVAAGIDRLLQFKMQDGRMSYWPGGGYEAPKYTLLYVASFLIEARNRGYVVPDDLYNAVMKGAGVNLDYSSEDAGMIGGYDLKQKYDYYYEKMQDDRAVQLYLAGLAGKSDTQALEFLETLFVSYYNDEKNKALLNECGYTDADVQKITGSSDEGVKKELKGYAFNIVGLFSEIGRYTISMAFSQVSNYKAAKLAMGKSFSTKYNTRELGDWLNSYNRNYAMYLKALAESENAYSDTVKSGEDELLKKLEKNGSFGSTQETAWALMALSTIAKLDKKTGGVQGEIYINDKLEKKMDGTANTVINDKKGAWDTVALKNTGNVRFYYSLCVEGIPKTKNAAVSANGVSISKKYFDENGNAIPLGSIKQGKLVVVTVSIAPANNRAMDNLVIDDMLPAGFEIENTRIRSHGTINFQPDSTLEPAYLDIRDDRMLIFTGAFSGVQTYSYVVRAVTPGAFIVPNAYVEAMYDPSINAEAYEPENLVVAP